jgi:hypothetical protein
MGAENKSEDLGTGTHGHRIVKLLAVFFLLSFLFSFSPFQGYDMVVIF